MKGIEPLSLTSQASVLTITLHPPYFFEIIIGDPRENRTLIFAQTTRYNNHYTIEPYFILAGDKGFEPLTLELTALCSTPELITHFNWRT